MAGLYEGYKNFKKLDGDMKSPTLVATIVSFIVGYAVINWLIGFLSKKGPRPFVWYRVAVGVIVIGLCAAKVIDPAPHQEASTVPSQVTSAN